MPLPNWVVRVVVIVGVTSPRPDSSLGWVSFRILSRCVRQRSHRGITYNERRDAAPMSK